MRKGMSKMKEKRIPEVRFEGFVDDWEQRKLMEVANISSGGTPSRGVFEFWDGEIPWATTTEVNYKLITNTIEKISKLGLDSSSAKLMPIGTILLAMYGQGKTRGKVGVLGIEAATNQANANIITNNDFHNYFVYYQLEKDYETIRKSANEGGQANLSLNIVKNISISISFNIAEQIKIGNFFKQLDEAITLQERKLSLLKLMKKGFLQQLFPKNEQVLPDIRFTNFQEVWEKRKLGNIVEIIMGQSPNSENYTDNPLDNILVQGNADMKNGRVVPRVWTKQITKKAERNDLILSVRAPVGDIGKTDYSIVIGRGVAAIRGNEFIFQTLGKMKIDGYWNKLSTGSTFESINSNDIKEAQIKITNIKEQTKIGNFFKQLDETITLQEKKIDQLKQIKKALLQKMFI